MSFLLSLSYRFQTSRFFHGLRFRGVKEEDSLPFSLPWFGPCLYLFSVSLPRFYTFYSFFPLLPKAGRLTLGFVLFNPAVPPDCCPKQRSAFVGGFSLSVFSRQAAKTSWHKLMNVPRQLLWNG